MADNKNMTQEEIDNGEEMTVTLTLMTAERLSVLF